MSLSSKLSKTENKTNKTFNMKPIKIELTFQRGGREGVNVWQRREKEDKRCGSEEKVGTIEQEWGQNIERRKKAGSRLGQKVWQRIGSWGRGEARDNAEKRDINIFLLDESTLLLAIVFPFQNFLLFTLKTQPNTMYNAWLRRTISSLFPILVKVRSFWNFFLFFLNEIYISK